MPELPRSCPNTRTPTRNLALQVGDGGIPGRHLLHRRPIFGVHPRRLPGESLLLALQPADDLK